MHDSDPNEALALQLKAATELFEKVAIDRVALERLSEEDRARLFSAARLVFFPDIRERRRLVKAKARARKADRAKRVQSRLNQTGIRVLRREKVFLTPNVFPPANF